MAMKLTWCPDLAAESNLRRLGVVFDVGKVLFSKLDLKESLVNGARLGDPVVKELVSDYRQMMLNGDTFPMPVVHPGKAGWVILSGVQRTTAVEALIKSGDLPKDPQIECYKIEECDQLLREIIARSFNCFHGGRQNQNERVQHAVHCVRTLGMQVTEAAKLFGVSYQLIGLHVRAEKERDSLMRSGVDASRLPVSTLDVISKIPFDENAKQQVAILAAQHDVTGDRVKSVIDGLKKAKTQQARTAKVKAFEKELSEEARATTKPKSTNGQSKVPSRPRRDKVLGICERLVQFLEHGNDGDSFTTLDQLQFSGDVDTARLKTLVGRLTLRWNVLGV
jgi:hypothetical protein